MTFDLKYGKKWKKRIYPRLSYKKKFLRWGTVEVSSSKYVGCTTWFANRRPEGNWGWANSRAYHVTLSLAPQIWWRKKAAIGKWKNIFKQSLWMPKWVEPGDNEETVYHIGQYKLGWLVLVFFIATYNDLNCQDRSPVSFLRRGN